MHDTPRKTCHYIELMFSINTVTQYQFRDNTQTLQHVYTVQYTTLLYIREHGIYKSQKTARLMPLFAVTKK